MELRCAYLAVLMGLLCGPALGVDHVVVLDDPDMFGAGWWTAVSGPDMDNGSAWLLQLGEWQQVGTLNLSSLFGISAMPRIDDWSWFGMKINRGDNAPCAR